jgi:hypothetical protein
MTTYTWTGQYNNIVNKTNTTKNIIKMSQINRTETGNENWCCQRVSSIVSYKTHRVDHSQVQ